MVTPPRRHSNPKCIRIKLNCKTCETKIELKEIDKFTIVAGNFNIPLLITDKLDRKSIRI